MIDIENKSYQPDIAEIREYIDNKLFDEFYEQMVSEYRPIIKIEYSGDRALLGWNVKFKKSGRTLCTIYPRRGHFPMLLVVGQKEKQSVEEILVQLCNEFCKIYEETKEGMGQRWLLLDFASHTQLYDDAFKIIKIRRLNS